MQTQLRKIKYTKYFKDAILKQMFDTQWILKRVGRFNRHDSKCA